MTGGIQTNNNNFHEVPLLHSAGGVIIHNGKVLTIAWTTHDYICLPKGGIDEGETSEEAAVREVLEETGYVSEVIAPLGSWTYDRIGSNTGPYRKTVDYYLMRLKDETPQEPRREPGELFENRWLDISEAAQLLTHDDAKEAFIKAQEGLEYGVVGL